MKEKKDEALNYFGLTDPNEIKRNEEIENLAF